MIRQDEVRMPPHSVEAEQAVLGGLMLDANAWDAVADIITGADFYRRDHRLIFEAIAEVVETRGSCDAVTISEHLERKGRLDEIGGLAYLGTIARDTPSAANVRAYAEIIRERSILRLLVSAGGEIAAAATDSRGRPAHELVDEAERRVFEIAERGSRGRSGFVAVRDILPKTIDRLDTLHQNPGEIRGVPTGFTQLDKKTAGLQPGDLVVIAGRPSMGKIDARGEHRRERRDRQGRAGRDLHDGNVVRAADAAHDFLARPRQRDPPADREFHRRGLVADPGRDGAAFRRADLPGRVAGAHPDGAARPRAAPEARARARPRDRRLPPAHAGAGHQGKPGDRDLRDLARTQGARQGAAGPGHRASRS